MSYYPHSFIQTIRGVVLPLGVPTPAVLHSFIQTIRGVVLPLGVPAPAVLRGTIQPANHQVTCLFKKNLVSLCKDSHNTVFRYREQTGYL